MLLSCELITGYQMISWYEARGLVQVRSPWCNLDVAVMGFTFLGLGLIFGLD